MQSYFKQLVILGTLSALASCASTGEPPKTAGGDIDYHGSDCILIQTIRDYRTLDDRNLLIYGPGKRAYYVTLFRPSFELRSSFRMGFSSRDNQLCPFGGDGIVIGSLNPEEIGIQSISLVDEAQEQLLLNRYGKTDSSKQKVAPPPEDVEGAEIEEPG